MGYRDRSRSRSRDRRRGSRRPRDRSARRKRSRSVDHRKSDRRRRDESVRDKRRSRSRSRDDRRHRRDDRRERTADSNNVSTTTVQAPSVDKKVPNSSLPVTRTAPSSSTALPRQQRHDALVKMTSSLTIPQPSPRYCEMYQNALSAFHDATTLEYNSFHSSPIHPNDFRKYERVFSFWRKTARNDLRSIFEMDLLEARELFAEFALHINQLGADERHHLMQQSWEAEEEQLGGTASSVLGIVWAATHKLPWGGHQPSY